MPRLTYVRWSDADVELLYRRAPTASARELFDLLQGRYTMTAIRSQCRTFRIRKTRATTERSRLHSLRAMAEKLLCCDRCGAVEFAVRAPPPASANQALAQG